MDAPLSAAEQLRKELSAVTGSQPPPVQSTQDESVGLETRPPVIDGPLSVDAPAVVPEHQPETAGAQGIGIQVPDSYSGRVYLMFPSTLGQEEIESIGEILDDVAGSGDIVDNRLVSKEEGIQFTLELGCKTLSVAALRAKMPSAALSVISNERLKVGWPLGT